MCLPSFPYENPVSGHMHTSACRIDLSLELCTPEQFTSFIIGTPTGQKEFKFLLFLPLFSFPFFLSYSQRSEQRERAELDSHFDSRRRLVLPLTQPVWTNTQYCLNRTSAAAWSERHFMCSIISVRLHSDTPSLYLSPALTHNHSIEGRY